MIESYEEVVNKLLNDLKTTQRYTNTIDVEKLIKRIEEIKSNVWN